ncbi:50S ribosomal protein L19 [Candidatus Shapirobacteria bacterium]|nr:50S ribosomal protein L19 [Candidatus Shapirobacteria bacterium]
MAIKFTHQDTEFHIGDTVKVNYKIKEKDKEREQAFDGIILSISGVGENKKFLVSKNASDNVRVERIFPINSPWIASIKKLRSPKRVLHRAKLFFLRNPRARSI